jgi:hypothetical protein
MVPGIFFSLQVGVRIDLFNTKSAHWDAGKDFGHKEEMEMDEHMSNLAACQFPCMFLCGGHVKHSFQRVVVDDPSFCAEAVGSDFGLEESCVFTYNTGGKTCLAIITLHPLVCTCLDITWVYQTHFDILRLTGISFSTHLFSFSEHVSRLGWQEGCASS